VKEFHFSDAANKATFVTYIVKVNLDDKHDPAQTFAEKIKDPKLPDCKKEVKKTYPCKESKSPQSASK